MWIIHIDFCPSNFGLQSATVEMSGMWSKKGGTWKFLPDEMDKTLLPQKPNLVERQFLKWRFPAHLTLISISNHTFKATAIYLAEDDENIPYLQQAIWLATCQSWFVAQRWVTQRHLIQGQTSPPFLGLTWVNPCLCRHLKVWGAGAWGVPLNLIIQHCLPFSKYIHGVVL